MTNVADCMQQDKPVTQAAGGVADDSTYEHAGLVKAAACRACGLKLALCFSESESPPRGKLFVSFEGAMCVRRMAAVQRCTSACVSS